MPTNPLHIDINEAISSGKYSNKLPYPTKPKAPAEPLIFRMRAGDMEPVHIENLLAQRKVYADELAKHKKTLEEYDNAVKAYRQEENRLEGLFQSDCEGTCFGCATGEIVKKKKEKVWAKAWEHGHANGYPTIWEWYQEFAEVANLF